MPKTVPVIDSKKNESIIHKILAMENQKNVQTGNQPDCPIAIRFQYIDRINYALANNSLNMLGYLCIENTSDNDLHDISVSIDGKWLNPVKSHFVILEAGSVLEVNNLTISPDVDKLHSLTETIESSITVCISRKEEILLTQVYPLSLLACDQWPGTSICPEILASFVEPNEPLISRVINNASSILEELTGNGSLDEYQTEDSNRVRAQVAAIYKALRSESLIYSAPPASFENNGQRVRMAGKVLEEKLGTCLDFSLLFASCMEAIGLNPILLLLDGRAMVGCWLIDIYSNQEVGDDVSFLSKSLADGINELVVIESTMLSSSDSPSFDDAVQSAEKTLDSTAFICYIDVRRCRKSNIRPIPLSANSTVKNDGLSHDVANADTFTSRTRYDIRESEGRQHLTRVQLWERKLLDITLRNNLINAKLGRKIIQFISYNIDRLEDYMQDGKIFTLTGKPVAESIRRNDDGLYHSMTYRERFEELVNDQIAHGRIYSFLDDEELQSSLKHLYRESRTALEENGANSLFFAFGMLKWYESDKSLKPRMAPILLLPVDINRKNSQTYYIRIREEGMTINTTLLEMIKQNFNVTIDGLNPLPTDDHGIDVKLVLSIIRKHIKDLSRWDVIDESFLGIFSFNKFVMWNDVHGNYDELVSNPIIKGLIDKRMNTAYINADEIDARKLDSDCHPDDFAIPIDVDSSQLEAVVESGNGSNFILYGPPGTGKSQTITNMIANALFHGKRVLFVAEKKAALDVVQKRLDAIGLEPFCLELHSNKVDKKHLLEQLQKALYVTHITRPQEWEEQSEELFRERQELNRYVQALHRKHPEGVSLFDCLIRYENLHTDVILPSDNFTQHLDAVSIKKAHDEICKLEAIIRLIGSISNHSLNGLNITEASSEKLQEYGNILNELSCRAKAIKDDGNHGIMIINSPEIVTRLSNFLSEKESDEQRRIELGNSFMDKILDEDPDELQMQWNAAKGKWFIPRLFATNNFCNTLKKYNPNLKKQDIDKLISDLRQIRISKIKLERDSAGIESELGSAYIESDNLKALANFYSLYDRNRLLFERSFGSLDELSDQCRKWKEHLSEARNWLIWKNECVTLSSMHLEPIIDIIIKEDGKVDCSALADGFVKGCYKTLADMFIDEDDELLLFAGKVFEDKIEYYRRLTKQFCELTKKALYCKLAEAVPQKDGEMSALSELGMLKRYIASNGRGVSIRHIIDQIPTLLPRLCPCFLMSPISVAQFIDLKQPKFDLVIFDEASQMPTSEAVGAIARGKALVCVGDPKQMPPTNFFSSTSVDEDNIDEEDMESILDDCITLNMPHRYLSWHYRSRHESLISFSNVQYYNRELFTFPSVDDKISKVRFVPVKGTYDYGKTRCNQAEATAIVNEVIKRLKDEKMSKQSIGIVSFSKVQQNLIEDILTEKLSHYPQLEKLANDCDEPIFIKNLENVQGDERDVILFSVGYGPDSRGHVSMNFGPLNNKGGERRLNVAVSRARSEMMVFSTLDPDQIDLKRTNAKGVHGLKLFLEFAKSGRVPIPSSQMAGGDNNRSLVDSVANRLRAEGYIVDTFIGRSKFKIDLAVAKQDNPSQYVLGILTDGDIYRSTKTERDRDICQPSVLKGLGWHLMRIWSVDWIVNPDNVINDIIREINSTLDVHVERPSGADSEHLKKMPFSITEDEIIKHVESNAAFPYEESDPYDYFNKQYGLMNSNELIGCTIKYVISSEQPITKMLLMKRLASVYGRTKVTSVVRDEVNYELQRLKNDICIDNSSSYNGEVLWTDIASKKHYKDFRQANNREAYEIPLVEYCNAAIYAIKHQGAMPEDDLKLQMVKLIGFSRRGNQLQTILGEAVDYLKENAIISMTDNGLLYLT